MFVAGGMTCTTRTLIIMVACLPGGADSAVDGGCAIGSDPTAADHQMNLDVLGGGPADESGLEGMRRE